MDIRNDIQQIIEREFIGPKNIIYDGVERKPEEEILKENPKNAYLAGILYPLNSVFAEDDEDENPVVTSMDEDDIIHQMEVPEDASADEIGEDEEELLNCSNSQFPSAISITASVPVNSTLEFEFNAGQYYGEKLDDSQIYKRVPLSGKEIIRFDELPTKDNKVYKKRLNNKGTLLNLDMIITFRHSYESSNLYTFSLMNINDSKDGKPRYEECYYQCCFSVTSSKGFLPLQNNDINYKDVDFKSNQLLYRNIFSYATGHGCAADWQDNNGAVKSVNTAVFPSYEVKPIVPTILDNVILKMYELSDRGNKSQIITTLNAMCSEYENWIAAQESRILGLKDIYIDTAKRHMENCRKCLVRMRHGVEILSTDDLALKSFQWMNNAMFTQQLNYKLSKQWDIVDGKFVIKGDMTQPDIDKPETWSGDKSRLGKWRPFQLAFILLNIESIINPQSLDRDIVDLIWFPTGGGKTEAYLGLSAFTIFVRKMKTPEDSGTAILMRYTLRLLTAQQYERAAALICACEKIRSENESQLGKHQISIGLWVGSASTPNTNKDACFKLDDMKNNSNEENPFVILRCPWCGAPMGIIRFDGGKMHVFSYYKHPKDKRIYFMCDNTDCRFGSQTNPLPLYVVDEDIYKHTPTLVIGTVDKFATIPYREDSAKLFGLCDGKRNLPPDLIIQDELHLISGPLGSMVGMYETLIDELCTNHLSEIESIKPKIVASTATISRAIDQCQNLYCRGRNNINQFPAPGLDASDSFFAHEDKSLKGRRYVGVFTPGASSMAKSAIYLYSSLLYAVARVKVDRESDRDPYWTIMGYYNSIRELAQTKTWILGDIKEHLRTIYWQRGEMHDSSIINRRIVNGELELTSRIQGNKITSSLQELLAKYPKDKELPVDICLATNMISVGMDIPRLGLMVVGGQPKTTSEYIQATSRVGRDGVNGPGLVFTLYSFGKPRDRSHYEQFRAYHSRMYCNVEPTSITPFSVPVRDRALHAIVIGLIRLELRNGRKSSTPDAPTKSEVERVKKIIGDRVRGIIPEAYEDVMKRIDNIASAWYSNQPSIYSKTKFTPSDKKPLMYVPGTEKDMNVDVERSFPTPNSMRSVDSECSVTIVRNGGWNNEQ